MIRRVAFAVPVLLVAGAVGIILHGLRHVESVEAAPPAHRPRYELHGAEWTRYDAQGRTQMHATADTIRYFDDRSAELDDLHVDRLGSNPGPWHLTAPHGHAPAGEQRMQLTEPVKMRGALADGEPLEVTVDTMWVDLARREIYSDAPVTVTGPYRSLDAVGLKADWAGTYLQLLRNVRVSYERQG